MKRNMLIIVAVIAIVIITVAGSVGYFYLGSKSNEKPQLTTQEQVRTDVMNYIKTNHSDTAQYMKSLSWTGGDVTAQGLVGASTYVYTSGGWNVTMAYPIVLDPSYTVAVTYTDQALSSALSPYQVIWVGTWQSGNITETTYAYIP
jgi:hypothetical protein